MRRWSGPIPSIGLMAPWSTWYRPLYSCVFSTATMSRGSSTTQSTVESRRSSSHSSHTGPSQMLKQRWQNVTRSLAVAMACDSRSASAAVELQQVEGDPLRGLRADAGEPAELVDELLDRVRVDARHRSRSASAEQVAERAHRLALRAPAAGR